LKVEFKESFLKDIKSIRDKSVLAKVKSAIESVELADTFGEITHLKKMRGSREYYRIRIGDFRIGTKLDGNTLIFIRCLNRKVIYRYFP